MDTVHYKVIRIVLLHLLLKHIFHFLFMAVTSIIFKQFVGNTCGTFVHITLVWTLGCLFSEEWSHSFIYNTCYAIGIVIWCCVSLFLIQLMFIFVRHHFVTKCYTTEHWPVAIYLICIFFAQDYGLNFIPMIPFHFTILFLILTHVITRNKELGSKGLMLLVSITVASNKWCEHWVLIQTCLVMAVTLEYIHGISIFFFKTFVPRLYAIPLENIKQVLDQDLNYVIREIGRSGICYEEAKLISTVYTNLFVDRKSRLHISYQYGQANVSEYTYQSLTENPYEDPNYCDRNGHCPLWYITKMCCRYSVTESKHLTGYYPSVSGAIFQKTLMMEFVINVQAGFRIFKCAEAVLYCLRNAIHKTNKTKVFLFLHEAGILRNFYNLRGPRSDKWDKFTYPLSLKRLCGNVIRVTLRQNAYLGVKHLCNQGYLPNADNVRQFITLNDIFSSYRELADYVLHQ